MSFGTHEKASQQQREVALTELDEIVDGQIPSDWKVQATGQFSAMRDWSQGVQSTQLRSFPIAFGIVFLLVSIFLRFFRQRDGTV